MFVCVWFKQRVQRVVGGQNPVWVGCLLKNSVNHCPCPVVHTPPQPFTHFLDPQSKAFFSRSRRPFTSSGPQSPSAKK